jgi:competence protein ComEA
LDLSVFTGRRVAVGLVVLAAIGLLAGYGMAMRARPEPVSVQLTPAPSPEESTGTVYVHVGGAVERSGLYELPPGSRVNDALEAAGGATANADIDAVNLAAPVSDGDKVLIPERGETQGPPDQGGSGGSGQQLININTASASDLEALPGIGPALAQRIVAFREERGGFRTIEELLEVSGIGPRTFENLRDLVTV